MATGISEEDFLRVQSQLIEFKASNYALEERCQKQHNELEELHRQNTSLEKEWQKVQKVISKSKKIQDLKILMQENESLQLKLQSQEDEFRLQNSTLIEEMSSVLQANENLEKENKLLKLQQDKQLPWNNNDELQMEVCKLQAENSVLKKNISDVQETYEAEIGKLLSVLRNSIDGSDSTVDISSGDIEEISDANGFQQNEHEDYEVVKVGNGEVSFQKSSGAASLYSLLQTVENKIEEYIDQLRQLTRDQLEVETLRQENNLLQQHLKSQQKPLLEKTESMENTITELADKLKRKQTSLTQLQSEKESMYNLHLKAIKELENAKDQEINQLKGLVQQLQTQFHNALQEMQALKERSAYTIREFELKVFALQQRTESRAASDNSPTLSDEIVSDSQTLTTSQVTENVLIDNSLREKLEKLNEEYCVCQKRVESLEAEKLSLIEELEGIKKTAEKRKCLLDEMAIVMQARNDSHRQEIADLSNKYMQQIESLKVLLEEEKTRSAELESLKTALDNLLTEKETLECSRDRLERKLSEAETRLENTTRHYETMMALNDEEYKSLLVKMQNEHKLMEKDLKTQLEISYTQLSEYEEKIAALKQEIQDNLEDRKIHDKKGSSIVKDLKRQLLCEKKRAENLQERLQEFLTEGHSRNDIFKPLEMDNAETSSISSWSMMSGGGGGGAGSGQTDNKDVKEEKMAVPEQPDYISIQDNELLIKRIEALQKENWILEERLNHLEQSSAAMADDIVRKTNIIQYYCMEGRAERSPHSVDKMTVKKLMDFLKDKGEDTLKDDVRKTQRMLEEMLTRNMNLEKDLETMSQEVVRLSKLVAVPSAEEKDLG